MEIINKQTISEQVLRLLEERISSGKYLPGERIPSESELSQELDVSRASVRTALSVLASAGLISRKHGNGTYVSQTNPGLTSIAASVWEFKHLIQSTGRECSIRGLDITQRTASDLESSTLELEAGARVIAIRRLFYANEDPIIYSINVLPVAVLKENCPVDQIDLSLGLDDFIAEYCDNKTTGVKVELSAVLGDEDLCRFLKVGREFPLLKLVEIFHAKEDKPLIFANNYIREFSLPIHVLRPW